MLKFFKMQKMMNTAFESGRFATPEQTFGAATTILILTIWMAN